MTGESEKDLALKKELEKLEWRKFIEYGTVRVQIREGKLKLTAIERTYPD